MKTVIYSYWVIIYWVIEHYWVIEQINIEEKWCFLKALFAVNILYLM